MKTFSCSIVRNKTIHIINLRLKKESKFSLTILLLWLTVWPVCTQPRSDLSLNNVVNILALESTQARIEKLNFKNKLLQYENYKKGFLPSVSFNLSPFSFNRSLKLLQHPNDGSYTYVDDYTNNSSAGVTVSQKIGLTGGSFTFGSNIIIYGSLVRIEIASIQRPTLLGIHKRFGGLTKHINLKEKLKKENTKKI